MKISELLVNVPLVEKHLPTSMQIGNWKVELKSFKETVGHDDSLPYQGKLYINDKLFAIVYNDGWGGETNIMPKVSQGPLIIYKINEYLTAHKEDFPMGMVENTVIYARNLSTICDILADNCSARNTIAKNAKNKLVIYHPKTGRLASVSFKNIGKKQLPELLTDPSFKKLYLHTVNSYQALGYDILNAAV